MRKRVSLKDIANKLGVSISLVSYVLNNHLENRINKETAEKIRRMAAEMNYQPNQIAKSLKSNKTQTLGLIVADISNPFSSSLARIIEDEAKKSGYTVIFGSADESAKKARDLINVLLSRQVDGFIIAAPEGLEKQLLQMKQEDVPFVLVDRYFPKLNTSYIAVDNFNVSFKAVKHLLDNGFKNIGIINYKTTLFHLKERTNGYKQALKQTGHEVVKANIVEIERGNLALELRAAIDEMMGRKDPIEAIFFSSSNVAIEGLTYLAMQRVKIPDQLGVICFDKTKAYDLFQYPVTYIKQPLQEIGQLAIKLILDAIQNSDIIQKTILCAEMVVRSSSVRQRVNAKNF